MTIDKPYIIVDNFFENPHYVRNLALSKEYFPWHPSMNGIFSGFRSPIKDIRIEKELVDKIQLHTNRKIKQFHPKFHINSISSMHGYPHKDVENKDNETVFAGVVYLNDNYPTDIECGTTIYEDPSHDIMTREFFDTMEIVYNTSIRINNHIKQTLSKECLIVKESLKKIISVGFAYNRMVCYPANMLHSPDFYFGNTKETSRLTIAFHGEFE